MALDHLKSASITNLDALPRVANTAGEGAVGEVKKIDTGLTLVASGNQASTYQFVRVASNSVIKAVDLLSPSQGTVGIFDVGLYYATDGSSALSKTALVAADAIDADLFIDGADAGGQAVFVHAVPGGGFSITGVTPAILANAAWTALESTKELWEVAGLTVDPKCNFDIVATLTDEAAGTAAANVYLSVEVVK